MTTKIDTGVSLVFGLDLCDLFLAAKPQQGDGRSSSIVGFLWLALGLIDALCLANRRLQEGAS